MHTRAFKWRSGWPQVQLSATRRAYESHFLAIDWLVPALLGLAGVLLLRLTVGDDGVQMMVAGNRAAVYGAAAGVAGSLLGFAIALIPITQGLLSLEGLSATRRSRHAKDLFRAFLHTVFALAIVTVVAFAALLFDRDTDPRIVFQYGLGVLILVASWKLAMAIRVMWMVLELALSATAETD